MSNRPYGLSKYLELSKNKNLPKMMSVQKPCSLVNRTYEIGMSKFLREKCIISLLSTSQYFVCKIGNNQMPKNSRILFKGWEE